MQSILVIRENAVDLVFNLIKNGAETGHGIAGESNSADFARCFGFKDCRNGFFPNLGEFDELDVVKEEEVEVIGPKSVEGGMDGFFNACCGKIKVAISVASELGPDQVGLAGNSFKGLAEHDFRHSTAVKRRGVDKVDAEVQGGVDGAERFIKIDSPEFGSQR